MDSIYVSQPYFTHQGMEIGIGEERTYFFPFYPLSDFPYLFYSYWVSTVMSDVIFKFHPP